MIVRIKEWDWGWKRECSIDLAYICKNFGTKEWSKEEQKNVNFMKVKQLKDIFEMIKKNKEDDELAEIDKFICQYPKSYKYWKKVKVKGCGW